MRTRFCVCCKESVIWKFPWVPSSCGRQFLSVCLFHRNMSPSGCLHTEIIAPLYSAHLAALLKSSDAPTATVCVQNARPTWKPKPHNPWREKKPTWPCSNGSILAAENERSNVDILHVLATALWKSLIKQLAQSAWLTHLSALFYSCSQALLSVFFFWSERKISLKYASSDWSLSWRTSERPSVYSRVCKQLTGAGSARTTTPNENKAEWLTALACNYSHSRVNDKAWHY